MSLAMTWAMKADIPPVTLPRSLQKRCHANLVRPSPWHAEIDGCFWDDSALLLREPQSGSLPTEQADALSLYWCCSTVGFCLPFIMIAATGW